VAGGRDGQEFGQSFHYGDDDALNGIHLNRGKIKKRSDYLRYSFLINNS